MAEIRLEDRKMNMCMSPLRFGNRTICTVIVSNTVNKYCVVFYLRPFGTNHFGARSPNCRCYQMVVYDDELPGRRNKKLDKSQSRVEVEPHLTMSSDPASLVSKRLMLRKPSRRQYCLGWDT